MIELELTDEATYLATCKECRARWTADTELELGDGECLLLDHEAVCRG